MQDGKTRTNVEFILEYDDSNSKYFRIKNEFSGYYLTAIAGHLSEVYQTSYELDED